MSPETGLSLCRRTAGCGRVGSGAYDSSFHSVESISFDSFATSPQMLLRGFYLSRFARGRAYEEIL